MKKELIAAGQIIGEDEDPAFEDIIKKPVKNAGFMQEEKKQINCQDWKS